MTWFQTLTACSEDSRAEVHRQLAVEGVRLRSLKNGRDWICGTLEVPTLSQLRERVCKLAPVNSPVTVREVVADVQKLHADPRNSNALFQVASQFNLLEMTSPHVTPEHGIGIYETDRTQGPACAIAAGAGTIYRNYFAAVNGRVGQTADNQIDCLEGVGALLGNSGQKLWNMTNGYALPSSSGLATIDRKLESMDESARDQLRQALRIGLQWDTQVTMGTATHLVSQAYCSALPVAYASHAPKLWARFATLILEASYEATFCAAMINAEHHGNRTLFLTLLGGGVFGNDTTWITSAIRRSMAIWPDSGLDVAIVSYGRSQACVQELTRDFADRHR